MREQEEARKRKVREAPPGGVVERLEELLAAEVLDDVLAGLAPEEIIGRAGC